MSHNADETSEDEIISKAYTSDTNETPLYSKSSSGFNETFNEIDLLHNLNDENLDLKKRYKDLEIETESLRILSNRLQKHQRNELGDEERLETILVREATSRENQLRQQLSRLEADLRAEKSETKSLRQELDRMISDHDRLDEINQSAMNQLKKIRSELKELKIRDLRLEEENGVLEEENVNLQSSISKLKGTMVTYDSLQHENDYLKDELAEFTLKVEEISNLKAISENQVEELFENLKEERQLKYQLKRELATQLHQTSLTKISDLVGGIGQLCNTSDKRLQDEFDEVTDKVDMAVLSELHNEDDNNVSLAAEGLLNTKDAYNMQKQFNETVIENNIRLQNMLSKLGYIDIFSCSSSTLLNSLSKQDEILGILEARLCNSLNESEIKMMKNELNELKCRDKMKDDILSKPLKLMMGVIDDLNQLRPDSDFECDITESGTDLIHVLNSVAERIALQVRQLSDYYQSSGTDHRSAISSDESESPESIHKLKLLLAQKRDKISTLRFLLEEDRKTAQVALANLKTKFENDKLAVTETMRNLRNELKTFKRSAASFAKFRALFAARGDEYVEEIETRQKKIHALEEENNMLNSLLRMSIEQKVNLTGQCEGSSLASQYFQRTSMQKQQRYIPPRMQQAMKVRCDRNV